MVPLRKKSIKVWYSKAQVSTLTWQKGLLGLAGRKQADELPEVVQEPLRLFLGVGAKGLGFRGLGV